MHKTKKILGTMAVYPESARCLGRVRDLVVDLDGKRIPGAILPGKTWLHPPVWLDFSHIRGLGPDALTVEEDAVPVSTKEIRDFQTQLKNSVRNLWGLSVISCRGTLVGYVEDLAVNIPGGYIVGIELSRGVLGDVLQGRGFLPAEEIVSMSRECIIVEGQQLN